MTIGLGIIVVLSVFYHVFLFGQAKKGFADHLAIDQKVLSFGIATFVVDVIVLAFLIWDWTNLAIWIALLILTALWFVFSLTTLTKKVTPKDELLSVIGSIGVVLVSLAAIVLSLTGGGF